MATVGDDNALIVTCYRVNVTASERLLPQIVMECQFLESSAHSSSITGESSSNKTCELNCWIQSLIVCCTLQGSSSWIRILW